MCFKLALRVMDKEFGRSRYERWYKSERTKKKKRASYRRFRSSSPPKHLGNCFKTPYCSRCAPTLNAARTGKKELKEYTNQVNKCIAQELHSDEFLVYKPIHHEDLDDRNK